MQPQCPTATAARMLCRPRKRPTPFGRHSPCPALPPRDPQSALPPGACLLWAPLLSGLGHRLSFGVWLLSPSRSPGFSRVVGRCRGFSPCHSKAMWVCPYRFRSTATASQKASGKPSEGPGDAFSCASSRQLRLPQRLLLADAGATPVWGT